MENVLELMHYEIVQFSILSLINICLYYSSNVVATTFKHDYSPIFFLDSCSFFINVITQQNNSMNLLSSQSKRARRS